MGSGIILGLLALTFNFEVAFKTSAIMKGWCYFMFIIDTIRCYIYSKRIKKYVREYGLPKQSENNLSTPLLDELMQKTKKELTDRA